MVSLSVVRYAVGDIHGCDELLKLLYEHIDFHHQKHHAGKPAEIVHIGDYIDRGLNSVGVIDCVMEGLSGFRTVALMGNHERMMLDCLVEGDGDAWNFWLLNGGDKTLISFGVSFDSGTWNSERLAKALGKDRIDWLRSLALYYRAYPYFFVHAGIAPGIPLAEQKERALLWIRDEFLNSDIDYEVCVIHGHTPVREPQVRPNRINIDTGAVFGGKLTAAVLAENEEPRFLSVE